MKNCEVKKLTYTRQQALFSRRPAAEYRQILKNRLKHWRKLCNLSQAQAARLAGVSRSAWQAWESSARAALPDLAHLAAVADGARVDPAASVDWLLGGIDRRML